MAHGREPGLPAAERRLRRLRRLPRRLRHVHRVARRLLQSGGRAEPRALQDGGERRLQSLRGALHAGRQGEVRERQADRAQLHQGAGQALARYEPRVPRQDEGVQAAVLPLPRDARLPFRQLSVRRMGRQVDVAHRVRRLHGADGLHAGSARRQARGHRRARQHSDPAVLRQRPRVRGASPRSHAVPRLQGLELGRRRPRARRSSTGRG